MSVRDYVSSDKEALEQIHQKMGLDYRFPDLENALFFVKKVSEVNGEIKGGLVLKLCAETMLLLNDGPPGERFDTIRSLQDAVLSEAYVKGLGEVFADVPDSVRFDRRLTQLGWEPNRPGWKLWQRSTR